jgi:pyruvate formate lyase activating enzyme
MVATRKKRYNLRMNSAFTSPLEQFTRRRFIELAGCGMAAACVSRLATAEVPAAIPDVREREALFYTALDSGRIQCRLCPRQCVIAADRQRGACGARENRGGRLVSLVYNRPCARHLDPIEKKPLFHVLPGGTAYSIGTAGCNIHCKFCQNWDISQVRPESISTEPMTAEAVVREALAAQARVIAYTYNEPTVFYEYLTDCARAGNTAGRYSVMITNGYIQAEPQAALLPLLKAVKVDLKAFTDKFYAEICDGTLAPVLDSLQRIHRHGTWMEIVVLLIPTLNDSVLELQRMTDWVVTRLGPDVPIHFTRYHPTYQLRNLPPTPPDTLLKARQIAIAAGCHFAYTGNVPGLEGQDTHCPACRKIVVRRYGYQIRENRIVGGKCEFCGVTIPGVWS